LDALVFSGILLKKVGGFVLKKWDDTYKLTDVLSDVESLTGDDAKSFLKLIYGTLSNHYTGNGPDTSEQVLQNIVSFYHGKIQKCLELRSKAK
jgi:hypothetical protein